MYNNNNKNNKKKSTYILYKSVISFYLYFFDLKIIVPNQDVPE